VRVENLDSSKDEKSWKKFFAELFEDAKFKFFNDLNEDTNSGELHFDTLNEVCQDDISKVERSVRQKML
jgi:hypothetical protein